MIQQIFSLNRLNLCLDLELLSHFNVAFKLIAQRLKTTQAVVCAGRIIRGNLKKKVMCQNQQLMLYCDRYKDFVQKVCAVFACEQNDIQKMLRQGSGNEIA